MGKIQTQAKVTVMENIITLEMLVVKCFALLSGVYLITRWIYAKMSLKCY